MLALVYVLGLWQKMGRVCEGCSVKERKIIELKKIREEDLLIHQKVKIRKHKGIYCCLLLCIGMIGTESVTGHVQIQDKTRCVFKVLYGISRRD